MKQRKNKLIKWLAGVALCTALISTATGVAIADTATPISEADYKIEMVGAEIRTDAHYGIRFKATTKAVRPGSKYYVMIVPAKWLTETDYDLQNAADGDYYAHLIGKGLSDVDDPATEDVNERDFITMQTEPEKIGDNLYELKGTISNVHFTNSNTKFFGIAYEEMANGTRNYAERNDKSVRSICWVAGAALNDENFDGDKTNLKPTIDRAYDLITNGTETGATLDLSKVGFKQNVYYTLDKGSVTPLEMVGLPKEEKLDLPIEYSVDGTSAITEDGVLTVNDETGYSFVKAKIAGETKNLIVYHTPKMAEGMLQDFAASHYENENGSTRTYDINTYEIIPTTSSGEWVESYTDAHGNIGYGVGKATKDKTYYSCGLRLNASRAELEAMNIETITVRFCATSPNAVANLSVRFFNGGYTAYPVNTWSYYTVTKASLISGQTGSTDEEKWNSFLDLYCNTGTGKIIGGNDGGCQNYDSGTQGKVTFYIDYVSVGTIRMEEHELENFNLPKSVALNNYITSNMALPGNANNISLVETQADSSGKTAYNVAKVTITSGSSGYATMRFARTAEELTAMMGTLDSITWRIMVDKAVTLKILGNEITTLTANKWTDVTLTKAQILTNFTGANEAEKISKFASAFCSTGTGNAAGRMFSVPSADCPVNLYVDGVTYTTTTAE
ncbi:MAG: hypothetical protein E7340_05520 [Clostridiales bacterium]|nr:hypothetical protein [Clostridiales bacterium]MBE5754768.1 hypothetical protein [Clostridiales bacterium]